MCLYVCVIFKICTVYIPEHRQLTGPANAVLCEVRNVCSYITQMGVCLQAVKCDCIPCIRIFNPLKPSGIYLYHLLRSSETWH